MIKQHSGRFSGLYDRKGVEIRWWVFCRGQFALITVHTEQGASVRQYEAMVLEGGMPAEIRAAVAGEAVGWEALRAVAYEWLMVRKSGREAIVAGGIADLALLVGAGEDMQPKGGETRQAARDRVAGAVAGLGLAKASFAMTLIHIWREAAVVCLGSHMLALFGWDRHTWGDVNKVRGKFYWAMEQEVLATTMSQGLEPMSAREVVWPHLQMLAHGTRGINRRMVEALMRWIWSLKNRQ